MNTATVERTVTGKEKALVEFYAQIARDSIARPGVFAGTPAALAKQARIGRSQLSQMLNGGKRTGRQSWKHVLPLLSVEALFHLKQCSAWNIQLSVALAELLAPYCGFRGARVLHQSDFGTVEITKVDL